MLNADRLLGSGASGVGCACGCAQISPFWGHHLLCRLLPSGRLSLVLLRHMSGVAASLSRQAQRDRAGNTVSPGIPAGTPRARENRGGLPADAGWILGLEPAR